MKKFNPERGQFFWYISEVIKRGMPDLEIRSSKFDPEKHKELLNKGNCYLTEQDAYNSLL